MSDIIFRTINGIVRPITVGGQSLKGKSKKSTTNETYKLRKNHYCDFRSFTVPNVKCKKCGQLVYYYEHPSGSRVLFDELGPPWPLHPCFSAEQSIKNQSVKTTVKSVNRKEKGWIPVVIKDARLLQERVEVCGHTEKGELLFSIPTTTLTSRNIQVCQVKNLLALVRPQGEKNVRVQLHDGKSSWEQKGTLCFSSGSVCERHSKPAVPLVRSEKKFKALTPLQNGLICIKDDKLDINFFFYGEKYHQSIGGNQWHGLRQKLDRLKLYFRNDKTGKYSIIYAINPDNRHFLNFVIKAAAKPGNTELTVNHDKRVKLEDVYLEDIDAQQVRLLGKVDNSYIIFYMPRKYLRIHESVEALLEGEIVIWLEHAGGVECHLYIDDPLGQQRKAARGTVAILSCTNVSQMKLPEPTDFVVEQIDIREDAHIQLFVLSKRKNWRIWLFVNDYQRNYLLNRFAAVAKLSLSQQIDNKKNEIRLYIDNRCIGFYKILIPDTVPTLKEVVIQHISEDTLMGMAFSKALTK